jgi:hypothetical protein
MLNIKTSLIDIGEKFKHRWILDLTYTYNMKPIAEYKNKIYRNKIYKQIVEYIKEPPGNRWSIEYLEPGRMFIKFSQKSDAIFFKMVCKVD